MKKTMIIAALAVVAILGGCSGDDSEVIMSVGGVEVTQNDYDYVLALYRQNYGERTGDEEMIYDYIMDKVKSVAAAQNDGLTFDEAEVDSARENIIDSLGGRSAYKKMLKDNGIEEDFLDMLWIEYDMADEAISEKINTNITDGERQAYYNEHYRRAKHILFSTVDTMMQPLSEEEIAAAKARADEVYRRILDGEDFDAFAGLSEDPGASSNPNGYVFTDDEMVPEFEEAVDSVGIGGIAMAETDYGYHIIKRLALDETPEIYQEGFEQAKDKIDSLILDERKDEYIEKVFEEKGVEYDEDKDI